MQRTDSSGSAQGSTSVSAFKLPKTKGLNRPGSWFSAPSNNNNSTSNFNSLGPNSPNPFVHPPSSFRSPFPSSKGKHKLSPSPSPRQEDDFVMISPVKPRSSSLRYNSQNSMEIDSKEMMRTGSGSSSSSPLEDSPTPACGMASATARLQLGDDDSPIRRVPGQSRSLAKASKILGDDAVFLTTSTSQDSNGEMDWIRRTKQSPASPLKFTTFSTGMFALEDGEESPQLPPTPSMSNNLAVLPPPQPLFPPLRASQSQDCQSSSTVFKSTSGLNTLASSSKSWRDTDSRIPRLVTSFPTRARASTDADPMANGTNNPGMTSKKLGSLDQMASKREEPFGGTFGGGVINNVKKPRSSVGPSFAGGMGGAARSHRRGGSGEHGSLSSTSISRSFGHKSGLALTLSPGFGLSPLPDFSNSNSSLSSVSTSTRSLTPPLSAFSPAEPPIFEDVKPLQEAFESAATAVARKFKPRDSGVSMGEEENKPAASHFNRNPPPSTLKPSAYGGRAPKRPSMLKRTSSMGDERNISPDVETPGIGPSASSGWPTASSIKPFDFLGENGSSALGLAYRNSSENEKLSMPGTPVKKQHFVHPSDGVGMRVGHSISQPTLGSGHRLSLTHGKDNAPLGLSTKDNLPAAERRGSLNSSQNKSILKTAHITSARTPHDVLHLTLTTSSSSPDSPCPDGMDTDEQSPTVRVGGLGKSMAMGKGSVTSRVGLLRRLSSGNGSGESADEEEGTPTKGGGDRTVLGSRPSEFASRVPPSPLSRQSLQNASTQVSLHTKSKSTTTSILPRLSMPVFQAPKLHRKLNHRQSHPPPGTNIVAEEDLYEKRFITLDTLGKGAFSTVLKAQERDGDGIYAVKRARGVFDGVKDRIRHLEEVDILRHLSRDVTGGSHVIRFVDAWEQNRQLFIQTELCLGSLAFFLEEYGRVVERLDEGRVWKIVSELSDGINHIHSSGVIHFDIKPANILISPKGSLKIADFGLATRWPRLDPAAILEGSGLGGSTIGLPTTSGKLEREGDRVYMPPEMLRGEFVMAADIFSFGLVLLEVSTNICVPDGGAAWQALRSDDFSVVDLTPLSPALVDLITNLMRSDPATRPTIQDICQHPVIVRAGRGKEALAPEDPRWLVEVLTGGESGSGFVGVNNFQGRGTVIEGRGEGDGDVEMRDT